MEANLLHRQVAYLTEHIKFSYNIHYRYPTVTPLGNYTHGLRTAGLEHLIATTMHVSAANAGNFHPDSGIPGSVRVAGPLFRKLSIIYYYIILYLNNLNLSGSKPLKYHWYE